MVLGIHQDCDRRDGRLVVPRISVWRIDDQEQACRRRQLRDRGRRGLLDRRNERFRLTGENSQQYDESSNGEEDSPPKKKKKKKKMYCWIAGRGYDDEESRRGRHHVGNFTIGGVRRAADPPTCALHGRRRTTVESTRGDPARWADWLGIEIVHGTRTL